MKKLGLVLIGIVVLALGVGLFFYDMGIDNKEMALRERFKGQEKICKTSHDNMFKVITQGAEVTDKYSADFESIFGKIAGDLMDDNAMLQLVSGFNPNLSPDIYKELMATIKTERAKFKQAQDICIDVSREYATYIKTKPTTWFINDEILEGKSFYDRRFTKEEIVTAKLTMETEEAWKILSYKPVTSTTTEDVFEKGVDDNIELFSKKDKNEITENTTSDEDVEISNTKKELTDTEKQKLKKYLDENPEVVLAVGNQVKKQ